MRTLLTSFVLLVPAFAAGSWRDYRDKPDEWFRSDAAKEVAANVLAWQTELGDWPNDADTFGSRPADAPPRPGTFDDGHTTHETRFLVRMYGATGDETYRDAALRAIDHVMQAQYSSGGFPQQDPPGADYRRYITFNDRTTVNLLELLRDVSQDEAFAFVGDERKRVAARRLDAGLRGILALQIQNQHGLMAWAAQYDQESLLPQPGRPFEPAALAAAESADILLFLMSIEEPGPEILLSVEAGVNWFHRVQINDLRVIKSDGDTTVVGDRSAPPVWARFYDLDTLKPIFAGRDGVVKLSLAKIEQERRAGYVWYGNWGDRVFEAYQKWSYRARE